MLYRNQDFSLKFKFMNKGKCDVVDYILVLGGFCLHGKGDIFYRFIYLLIFFIYYF